MTAKKNAIAKDLRSPKYRPRVVKSKKAYSRRPKHPARAADAFRDTAFRDRSTVTREILRRCGR